MLETYSDVVIISSTFLLQTSDRPHRFLFLCLFLFSVRSTDSSPDDGQKLLGIQAGAADQAPSTPGRLRSAAAFSGLTLPPYCMASV